MTAPLDVAALRRSVDAGVYVFPVGSVRALLDRLEEAEAEADEWRTKALDAVALLSENDGLRRRLERAEEALRNLLPYADDHENAAMPPLRQMLAEARAALEATNG